jgi:DNA invertase Pin-like site-specific DNA recombinase
MSKVDKNTRLQILFQVDHLLNDQCAGCPHNAFNNYVGDPEYCRNKCEIGLRLQQLGEKYCGSKFIDLYDDESELGRPKVELDKNICRNLYRNGLTKTKIGDKFNVNRATIAKLFKEWGIKDSELNINEINQIKQLHKQGFSQTEIGKEMGLSPSVVHKRLKKLKLI